MIRGVVDVFWNMDRRGVFTVFALLSPPTGESESRPLPASSPAGYGEQKAGRRRGRTIQCPTDVADLGSTDTYCVGELPLSANWPAQENLAPVQGPRCPALEVRASAELRCTALLVLTFAQCCAGVAAASLGFRRCWWYPEKGRRL